MVDDSSSDSNTNDPSGTDGASTDGAGTDGENAADIPDEWYRAVHPRRGGMTAWGYSLKAEQFEVLHTEQQQRLDEFKAILSNPASDPAVVALVRGKEPVDGQGARFAIENQVWSDTALAVPIAALYVHRIGLPRAAAACVESCSYLVRDGSVSRPGTGGDTEPPPWLPALALDHLRRLLAQTDQATHDATVEQLRPLRTGPLCQRILTSFLVPERRDWVAADFAALPSAYLGPEYLLRLSAFDPAQLRGWSASRLSEFVTTWDGLGSRAVPLLLRWYDRARYYDKTAKAILRDMLSRIPEDAAFDGLLARLDWWQGPAAVTAAAARFPRRATRLLARSESASAQALLGLHLKAHPDLAELAGPAGSRVRLASAEQVPALLSSPPWARPKRVRTKATLGATEDRPTIHWLEGEQEEWARERWPEWSRRTNWAEYLETNGATPDFFISGPEQLVRPMLADWAAEHAWFYLKEPRILVGKYELDALPPILRLAHRKPIIGAHLLLPYRSVGVALLMAKWLVTSRQFRPISKRWFDRHQVAAAQLLLPTALGGGTPRESRLVAMALARLEPDVVRAAGAELDCSTAVASLLATDPLDLIPARVPTVPSWLELDVLPQVLLRDGEHALPAAAAETLCRMIAMSDLDSPYEGLRVIADACDRVSLAAFVWALYGHWELAERPSRDVWAMNALGYFGDDLVADRLAPQVRSWPSEGASPRAKRGADVLAAMESDRALQLLGAIARNAKSGPLRAHAVTALDRAALDRGMLPEQLEDLLAPDCGLDDEPVSYRGVDYLVELGDKLDLVLQSPDGAQLATLPKALDDEEKTVVAGWNRRRRSAKSDIADQVRRLEEAMIVQRRWSGDEFTAAIAGHPLLGRLARRLIWRMEERSAAVDALGDLVDADGGLLSTQGWVQVAHPVSSDLEPWRRWFSSRRVVQPFVQIDRDVYDSDPSAHWARSVSAASLYQLIRRGWHWGPTGRAATRNRIFRPFGAEGTVVLQFAPGLFAPGDAAGEPDQTVESLTLESPRHGEFAVFSDLPRVTRSELLRDLGTLDQTPPNRVK